MTKTMNANLRLDKFARWGSWVSGAGALIFVTAFVAFYIQIGRGSLEAMANLIDDFGVGDLTQSLSSGQMWVLGVLWMVPDLFALAVLLTSFRLFQGFRHNGVFTHQTADRLRWIGWAVMAVAPARILCQSIGAGVIAATLTPPSGRIHLSLEDTDIYVVVFGLLFLSIGHIMIQAIDIADENRSFV